MVAAATLEVVCAAAVEALADVWARAASEFARDPRRKKRGAR